MNPIATLIGNDGLVHVNSVPLEGANNYGPYNRNHDELLDLDASITDTFYTDLYSELTT
jgi:hypothetical protein